MDQLSFLTVVTVGLAAALCSVLALFALSRVFGVRVPILPQPLAIAADETAFLFDGPHLLDATPGARKLLASGQAQDPDKADVGHMLDQRFPGLLSCLQNPSGNTTDIPASTMTDGSARVQPIGDTLRLTLIDGGKTSELMHPTTLNVMEDEISVLRSIGQDCPQLIWHLDAAGTVVWANAAYLVTADQVRSLPLGLTSDWPPIALFTDIDPNKLSKDPKTTRRKLRLKDEDLDRWYDVTSAPTQTGSIHFAADAQTTVVAERQARVFVQTLSKTFAQLSTGLAIFNRSRKLVMFNPALMDLTKLSASFLSGQPDLSTFLDRLRDTGVLPEPKNYASWREEVAALENKAAEGTYSDTWSLSTGETYKVNGRPHPDGALAFLIEDISAEISLTRTFRTELETTHAVIDAMDEAVAVFSASGTLMFCNEKYDELWDSNCSEITGSNLLRELEVWQNKAAPTPFWAMLRRYGTSASARHQLTESIQMRNGMGYVCRVAPLTGGTTLIGFRPYADRTASNSPPLPVAVSRTKSATN